MQPLSRRQLLAGAVTLGATGALGISACGSSSRSSAASGASSNGTAGPSTSAGSASASASSGGAPVPLRLGLFPNITHATALVAVHEGIFQQHLGSAATLSTSSFTAGGKAIEALFAGAIDATYVGPNPAINGFAKSKGKALRIISGATSGGAALIVRPGVSAAAQLKGKKLASPALGNTQDVALRTWLKQNGLHTDESGGGDVSILPQENAQTLDAFKSGAIDGAWVPEPWATRLVNEGNGSVLVDERSLWPNGRFVTTHLVVAASFLEAHPAVVTQLLAGQIAANDLLGADPTKAQAAANAQIEQITQKRLADSVIAAAWGHLEFTNDPIASSLRTSADNAVAIGLLDPVDLTGIYALDPLNSLLTAAGRPTVAGA